MDKNTKIAIVKGATTIVAGVAVAAVATAAIKNIIPFENLTKVNKVWYTIGATIIASMVADAGAEHAWNIVGSFITDTSNAIEEAKEELNPPTIEPEVI